MTVFKNRKKWAFEFLHKKRRIQGYGYRTRAEAKSGEAEMRKKIDAIRMDFLELCEARLDDVKIRRTKKHYRENKHFIERVLPEFVNKKQVTRNDVEKYLRKVARARGNMASNREMRFIKSLFQHGVDRNLLEANPVKGIKPLPVSNRRRYVPPYENIEKVLAVANPEQQDYLNFLLMTAARVREINRLRFDDIHDGFLLLKTRKSRNSDFKERMVPINGKLQRIIDRLPRKGEYVFVNPRTNTKYDYRSKMMRTLCRRADVKYFSFHALRHWCSSHMMKQGVPLTDIQAVLGHERVSTTSIYLRTLGDGTRKAVEALEVKE